MMREVRVPVATMWAAPDAPRAVDAAALLDAPDIARWAASVVTAELVGRTLTQLLLGEPALVLEERGDWVRCRALWQPSGQARGAPQDGYDGWVRRSHLGEPAPGTEGAAARVRAPSTLLTTALAPGSSVELGPPRALSFGTCLWVDAAEVSEAPLEAEGGPGHPGLEVLLPDGQRGRVDARDVAVLPGPGPVGFDAEELLDLARGFLGLSYLWGGTSCWGLDCSGLVHLTHRAFGVVLPRDACDMVASDRVADVPLDDVRPGDLYFFAKSDGRVTHVGFATRPLQPDGARWMLHAPELGVGAIEERLMTDERRSSLVAARRVTVG